MSFISRGALPYLSSLLAISFLLTLEMPVLLPEELQDGPTTGDGPTIGLGRTASPCRAVTQGLLQCHLTALLPAPFHYEAMDTGVPQGLGLWGGCFQDLRLTRQA